MAIDRSAYFQNVRVWARRMNVSCDKTRAEKALVLMERMNLSESVIHLVCVFFCLQKDRGDKDLELALQISIVAARATIEITRGNYTSGTDAVSVFAKWVGDKTQKQDAWLRLALIASLNRDAVNAIVADANHARNEEKEKPSLGNMIIEPLHREMRGRAS